MKSFKNIQALRAIAAIWVMAHHSLQYYYSMGLSNPVYEFIGEIGYLGVDVFFCD